MKGALAKTLLALGGGRLLRWRARHRLPILMYHGVVPRALTPFCWHQLDLRHFAQQMAYVAKHYRVVPLDRALHEMVAGTLAPRSLAITFDDGYRNNLTQVLPILERHALHATIFLATDYVGSDDVLWPDRLYLAVRASDTATWDASALDLGTLALRTPTDKAASLARVYRAIKTTPVARWPDIMAALLNGLPADGGTPGEDFRALSWEDVATMQATGRVAFAAHTRTHPILSQADDETVREQITSSHQAVIEHTHARPRLFAYPNGRTQDFDPRARAVLRELEIPFACSTELGLVDRTSDPLALPRVCVGADLSFDRFRLLVAGV